MHGQCRILLLTYLVAVATTLSSAFNIDLTNPHDFKGEQKDFFGYKVIQLKSDTNKGIVVTAPLHQSMSKVLGLYTSDNRNMTWFKPKENSNLNGTAVNHLGLSIAENPKGSKITVCSPNVVHKCYENSYLNSLCFNMDNKLQEISSFKPAFQECTKKRVDLVFLFDGSGSMTENEFNKNKEFIQKVMDSLRGTTFQFAAVQFSLKPRTVFDFNDFHSGSAVEKLMKEPHMKNLTNTHQALKFVLKELFENRTSGAYSDATKVVVVITDGEPSDLDDDYSIYKKYDEKKIIRFIIEVSKSKVIEKSDFKIDNYGQLTGILKRFQEKIFAIEGADVARAGYMTNEMSQSGFSAVYHKETLILGSVGTNSWRGALHERHGDRETEIIDPDMMMDSYMGYSTSVGERNDATLYFTGAPRFNHTGQVLLFRQNNMNWTVAQRINGEQIGSYFGAELCSLDVNSDQNTDFLLVGAPLFYQSQKKGEGQIYVYSLTDELELKSEMNVTAQSTGRFGTTISCLADLNGDGLRDIAVGAPLENDNTGSVYIYLGDRRKGIRSHFSQRIMGQKIQAGLRFFGQAIHGLMDFGEDGLTDIVVGSQGTVLVLRSKPVFNVKAHLKFQPGEISIDKIDCLSSADGHIPMGNLTVCFEMEETTKSKKLSSGLNISCTFDIDPVRQTHRGVFDKTNKKARSYTSTYELTERDTCFLYPVYMPVMDGLPNHLPSSFNKGFSRTNHLIVPSYPCATDSFKLYSVVSESVSMLDLCSLQTCVRDTLSPIKIKLNFSQVESENETASLNVDSDRQADVEVPFEKQCRKNDTCIAELAVDFNFMSPTLLVSEDNYFNVSIKLSNYGDDSYNTSLSMEYPTGLSFSTMSLVEASRSTPSTCYDQEEVLNKTVCGISLPVFRSQSTATFKTSFHVLTQHDWDENIWMTIKGNSDNVNSTENSVTKSLQVQFAVKMSVGVRGDSVTYLNFTPEDTAPKEIVIVYKIDNFGFKAFPVNVSLLVPTALEHTFQTLDYNIIVSQNKTQCRSAGTSDNDSQDKSCLIVCDSFILPKESVTEFMLTANVEFKDLKKLADNVGFIQRYTGQSASVKFKSSIQVNYDKERYVMDSHKHEGKPGETDARKDNDPVMTLAEVRVELIIPANELWIIATGVSLGILVLIILTIILIKLGFFKRKTAEYYEQQAEKSCAQGDVPEESAPAPTNGTIGQSETDDVQGEEEKTLLDGGEANDTIQGVECA